MNADKYSCSFLCLFLISAKLFLKYVSTSSCFPISNRYTELLPVESLLMKSLIMKNSPSISKSSSKLPVTITSKSKNKACPCKSAKFFENVVSFNQPLSGILFGKFKLGRSKVSTLGSIPVASSVKQTNLKGFFKFLETILNNMFT